ncbi:S8 family peptidase [Streptomyces liangshanensis]|uniref:S8 family peptidase n=1 Tax=Streptomyces liangshanensis TaxID=2717324 RepID=A0A6G9H714_9ACTN|nr:S8 family peptidase [Streptomyces liangshanensis]QIQ06280.1 S8 family peptidase [Streptomyces liangshanensis]
MVAALLTAGLTTGLTAAAPNATGTSAGEAPRTSGTSSVVTLITGDRVYADAKGRVSRVRPAEGRDHIAMAVRRIDGRTYVLPADAAKLVSQGKLDRRLFDITGLIAGGYDDAHRTTLPLIVSYTQQKARAKSAFAAADVSVRRSLPALSAEAVTTPKEASSEVWQALTAPGAQGSSSRVAGTGIGRVWLDGKRRASLDRSVAQIGAPTAWQAGYDGKGVKIAVLDTGVDETHPDLKGVEIAQKDFSGAGNTVDHVGHGTHVASIAAGSGAKSAGKYKGVAPGAKILDGKVLDDDGWGDESGIIAGMQWAADQGAKVANLSLGDFDAPEVDPLEAAVDKLSADKGILFVVAAGNEGPGARTVGTPGSAPAALTVGAVDRADKLAPFSSVGPAADGTLKPDLTAPGVDIVAAKAAQGQIGDPAADGYVTLSGTSMATPHVAGAAAILSQEHPDWTGARIKQALTASAAPGTGLSAYQQGTGRVDLARAVTQSVVSDETSVSFGVQQWPHTDDSPASRTVTYRNNGAVPVTLDLATEATGPDGKAAPAGVFALDTDRLTVPAGGTAHAVLTSDTRVAGPDGAYSGAVRATATEGGQRVRTSFGVIREAESYDLTLKFIGAKGKPAQGGADIIGHQNDVWESPFDEDGDGTLKVRLPKGTYLLDVPLISPKADGTADLALLVQPKYDVTKNATLTFDARKAKPVSITPPGKAKELTAYTNYLLDTGNRVGAAWFLDSFKGVSTAQIGTALPAKQFSAQLGAFWQQGSTTYHLLYARPGSLFTGFTHKATAGELALVNIKIGAPAKKRTGFVSSSWNATSGDGIGVGSQLFALPGTAKTYITVPKGFTWNFSVGQQQAEDEYGVYLGSDGARTYQAKKTYTKTYNVGVFSPRVGPYSGERLDNDMLVCVDLFSDGAGHFGSSPVTKQRTVITADGKKLLDNREDLCQEVGNLPATSARYVVSTDASRSTTLAGVTTRLVASWSFTSKRPPATGATLPLSTVRFLPKLDLASTAAAGKKLTVPLAIDGPAAGKGFKSLAVQVSYDGGTKWAKAPVTTAKDGKKSLTLSHPKKATSVSFKAKLTDTKGFTYDVTVVKAYLLK